MREDETPEQEGREALEQERIDELESILTSDAPLILTRALPLLLVLIRTEKVAFALHVNVLLERLFKQGDEKNLEQAITYLTPHHALYAAVLEGNIALVNHLIEYFLRTNRYAVLTETDKSAHTDTYKPNTRDYTLLHHAIMLGNTEITGLIASNMEITDIMHVILTEAHGNNVLHFAAMHGRLKVLDLLLQLFQEHEALYILAQRNNVGKTALDIAMEPCISRDVFGLFLQYLDPEIVLEHLNFGIEQIEKAAQPHVTTLQLNDQQYRIIPASGVGNNCFFRALIDALRIMNLEIRVPTEPADMRILIADILAAQRETPNTQLPDGVRQWLRAFTNDNYETLLTTGRMIDNVEAVLYLLAHHFGINLEIVNLNGEELIASHINDDWQAAVLRYGHTHYDALVPTALGISPEDGPTSPASTLMISDDGGSFIIPRTVTHVDLSALEGSGDDELPGNGTQHVDFE